MINSIICYDTSTNFLKCVNATDEEGLQLIDDEIYFPVEDYIFNFFVSNSGLESALNMAGDFSAIARAINLSIANKFNAIGMISWL